MRIFARSGGREFELEVRPEAGRLLVRRGRREWAVAIDGPAPGLRTAFLDDRRLDFGWRRRDGRYLILIDGIEVEVEVSDSRTRTLGKALGAAPVASGALEVRAPIPGRITRVLRKAGESVRKNDPVLCLDAMKLENEIAAPRDGTLRSVAVRPGQPVEKGQPLFVVG